jgi:protein O-mannosyl-transferase
MPPVKRTLILCLTGLSIIILVAFSKSLRSDFVYDSTGEIVLWDYLHNPGNILTPLTFRLMTMDVLDFNRPVAVASLMYDSMVWGKAPGGYHLTNILLHAANACLAFLLIRHVLLQLRPGRNPTWRNAIAFLATLVFAVHPLVTEAVCEPSNRKDLLAALFGLGAILLAARHRPGIGKGDALRLFLVPLLCLLAIGSKEVGVAFPAVLCLYWFLFRRSEPGRFWAGTILGSTAVAVIFLVARFSLEHRPSEIFLSPPEYPDGSLASALLVQPRILALYLINVVWPTNLCADYTGNSIRFLPLALSLALLAILLVPFGWWAMKDRRVQFGGGLVIFGLLPVCNLVPIYHPAADRYLYLPLIGVAMLLALAADRPWLAAHSSRRMTTVFAFLVIIALLIPFTLQREKIWSNEVILWQDTLKRNPQSYSARVNLPEVLYLAGRLQEAREESERTLQTPYAAVPWVWVDYAVELHRLGDQAGAQRAARRAIELKPDVTDANKMIRTLQCPPIPAFEFTQIAASIPNQK